MALRNFIIATLFLLTIQCTTQKMQVTGITYTDQNNNRFFISSEILRYEPITAIESSSGTYDGGEKKTVALSAEAFEKLTKIATEIKNDSSSHSDQRRMMTSILSIKTKSSSKDAPEQAPGTRYILNGSALRSQLEQQLRELID